MRHILLTGEVQIGKSTAIARFLKETGIGADGFATRFSSETDGRELYIYRYDSEHGERDACIAAKVDGSGYTVFPGAFSDSGARFVRESGARSLIIMDELGIFEECAPEFMGAVFEKLNGIIPVLGVVKLKASPFLDAVRAHPKVEVVTVTRENREAVPKLLSERFLL